MEFELTHEKDAGPVVRWIATKVLSLLHKIEKPLYDYADMYTAVWDDEEDDFEQRKIEISDAPNQMVIFDYKDNIFEELI